MGSNQFSLPILDTASQPAIDPVCGMKVNVPTAKRTFNDSGPALQFLVWMRRLWLLLTTWQRTAFNGNRALDFKRRGPVDVVISDLNMAEMDGFALAEAITADGCWPNIRRIAVTMQPLGRVEKKARASGFEAEFEKPAKMSELVKWIELNCGTVSA